MHVSLPLFLVLFTFVLLSVALGLKFYEWSRKRRCRPCCIRLRPIRSVDKTNCCGNRLENGRHFEIWLALLNLLETIKKLIQQAGLTWSPEIDSDDGRPSAAWFFRGCFSAGYTGATAAFGLVARRLLPYLYVRRKRTRRLDTLEEQFPEALDFLARSMRAGHAFTISLRMVGEDLPDPLGQEFRTLFNEQNLGAPLDIALANFGGTRSAAGCPFLHVVGDAAEADRRQLERDSAPPGVRDPGAFPV